MGTSTSDINATFQKIAYLVRIGGTKVSNLLFGIDVSMGLSQINAACTLHFTRRPTGAEEKKSVEVLIGYSSEQGCDPVFKGELTGVSWDYFPGVVSFECRDMLARLRLPWGGEDRDYTSSTDAALIQNACEAMGISSSQTSIESSGWILGVAQAVILAGGRPFWPTVEEIDTLAGYRTFTDRNGVIKRRRISGNTGSGQSWTYTEGVNIIKCTRRRTVEGIVNRAIVTGLTYEDLVVGGPGIAEAYADNPFVPDPPKYITEAIQSDLVEDDDKAIEIATRIVADKNKRPEVFELVVPGNPKIEPLSVIHLVHSDVEAGSANLIVDRVQHTLRGSSFQTTITTLGGNVVATTSAIEPIPAFDVKLFLEGEDTGSGVTALIVGICDASASSDPDGDPDSLTYAWTVSVDAGSVDPASGTGVGFRFVITGAATAVTIELTVTDADSEVGVLERVIPITASTLYIEDLYTAETGIIAASQNGEQSWNTYSVSAGSTCLAPFAPEWGELWGAANGHLWASIDGLKTAAVDLGAPHGAVAVTAVWVHETDTTRAWAGFSDGKVYQGVIDPATPSATWTLRGTITGGPSIHEIREEIGSLGSLHATAGAAVYRSFDGGATWSNVHTFDVSARMAAGFELNLASGLNSTPPLYAEDGGTAPTVPGGVTHIRALTFGWRQQALYATDDGASLYTTDATFAALTAHADTLPAQGNHMIRSGNTDGVIYIAVGDGTGTNNGAVKWIPDTAAPFYIRKTTARQVQMIGYGPAHLPSVKVHFLVAPFAETDPAKDKIWEYRDGLWTGYAPPVAGWKWYNIKVHPTNTARWLLLGGPDVTGSDPEFDSPQQLDGGTGLETSDNYSPLWLTEDGGGTWTEVIMSHAPDMRTYQVFGVGWQKNTGRWAAAGIDSFGNANLWVGTSTTGTISFPSNYAQLRAVESGHGDDFIIVEEDSPLGSTAGGILLNRGTGIIPGTWARGDFGWNQPFGPLAVKPEGDTINPHRMFQVNRSSPSGINDVEYDTPGQGQAVIPGDPDAAGVRYEMVLLDVATTTDSVFLVSNESGQQGIYKQPFEDYDLTGAPQYASAGIKSIRSDLQTKRIVVASKTTAGFVVHDGNAFATVALPVVGMNPPLDHYWGHGYEPIGTPELV